MKDIEILQQLLSGNHLENKELLRAEQLNILFNLEIERRLNRK